MKGTRYLWRFSHFFPVYGFSFLRLPLVVWHSFWSQITHSTTAKRGFVAKLFVLCRHSGFIWFSICLLFVLYHSAYGFLLFICLFCFIYFFIYYAWKHDRISSEICLQGWEERWRGIKNCEGLERSVVYFHLWEWIWKNTIRKREPIRYNANVLEPIKKEFENLCTVQSCVHLVVLCELFYRVCHVWSDY